MAPSAGKKEELALEFQKLRLHRGCILHLRFSTHLGILVTLQGKSHSMLSSSGFVMIFYLGRVPVYWHAPEPQPRHSNLHLSVIPRMSLFSTRRQPDKLVVAAQVWQRKLSSEKKRKFDDNATSPLLIPQLHFNFFFFSPTAHHAFWSFRKTNLELQHAHKYLLQAIPLACLTCPELSSGIFNDCFGGSSLGLASSSIILFASCW